ncbi:MAG: hypothetical protein NUV57_04095 [archaeon]|nr:hypothetical protein [archaeon]
MHREPTTSKKINYRLPRTLQETQRRLGIVNAQITESNQQRTEEYRQLQAAKDEPAKTRKIQHKLEVISRNIKRWIEIKENLLAHLKKGFPREGEK